MSIGRQLIKHVRDLAEKHPRFTYESAQWNGDCVYVEEGKPSCIIGQAASLAGVPIATLEQWDRRDDSSANSVVAEIGVHGTRVRGWLRRVQIAQDRGYTWAEAVKAADTNHPLFNARDYA